MPRRRLDAAARSRGQRLAAQLAETRRCVGRSAEAIARSAGLSVETVRSIEQGRTPSPEFFTIAAIAVQLGLSLDTLYANASKDLGTPSKALRDEPLDQS